MAWRRIAFAALLALAASVAGAAAARAREPPREDMPPRVRDEDLPIRRDGIALVIGLAGDADRLERIRSEVLKSIDALTSDFLLNVHAFDATVRSWKPAAVAATREAKADARRFVEALLPGCGAATGPAIVRALEDREGATIVVFAGGLPDAGPATAEEHVALVAAANGHRASIHVFGARASTRLAEGFFRSIETGSTAPLLEARAEAEALARLDALLAPDAAPPTTAAVAPLLCDPSPRVRLAAIGALERTSDFEEAYEVLRALLRRSPQALAPDERAAAEAVVRALEARLRAEDR